MRDKLYDYRELRPSNICEPRFRHLLLLSSWIIYFVLYFLTENLIPAERCAPMHCGLDDVIPFCEYFVVFYVFWYLFIFGSIAYFLFFDVKSFSKLQIFIAVTQAVAMFCYIFFPTRQDLRPEVFARDNVFTRILELIYTFDTNTGVNPSLHVAYSCAVAVVFWYKKNFSVWLKALTTFIAVMICLSTAFVKQHSMVDVFFGVLTGAFAWFCAYGVPALLKKRTAGSLK